MDLKEFARDERLKYVLVNVMKLLYGRKKIDLTIFSGMDWDKVTSKMVKEWKELDDVDMEDDNYKAFTKVASNLDIEPKELLTRMKLIFYMLKSEIFRYRCETLKEELSKYTKPKG